MLFRSPEHIKGVAIFREINGQEGYWVYDSLGANYIPIEYNDTTCQWYFIQQDTRMHRWTTIAPVPREYNLGRGSIHAASVSGISVDKDAQHTVAADQHTMSARQEDKCTVSTWPDQHTMATTTETTTAAIATGDTNKGLVKSFTISKASGDGNPPPIQGKGT